MGLRKEWSERIRRARAEALNIAEPIIQESGSEEARFLFPIIRELTLGTMEIRDKK